MHVTSVDMRRPLACDFLTEIALVGLSALEGGAILGLVGSHHHQLPAPLTSRSKPPTPLTPIEGVSIFSNIRNHATEKETDGERRRNRYSSADSRRVFPQPQESRAT